MPRFGLFLLLLPLAACGRMSGPDHAPRHGGRYQGIGIYSPGPLWRRLRGAPTSQDAAAATLRDDEQIIVTVDSRTGQIRQCGNLSGHCIRMNPWSGAATPARLGAHAEELESGNEADPVTNAR